MSSSIENFEICHVEDDTQQQLSSALPASDLEEPKKGQSSSAMQLGRSSSTAISQGNTGPNSSAMQLGRSSSTAISQGNTGPNSGQQSLLTSETETCSEATGKCGMITFTTSSYKVLQLHDRGALYNLWHKAPKRRRSSKDRNKGPVAMVQPAQKSLQVPAGILKKPAASQEEMKLALVLNVVDPRIGGVMVMGDRGTGKTTAVRALADLLPSIEVVNGDPFNSDPSDPDLMGPQVRERLLAATGCVGAIAYVRTPLVELPLGATEDKVCGTIDFERALLEGVKAFEPGLLAKANRGILYVDEVNLLGDHLVDVLLDSAASGWNTVEREGISISHPARFILVGSGNPEEGELRPQLLDRFGLHAFIKTARDPHVRVKVVEERQAFDDDPLAFRAKYQDVQTAMASRIVSAHKALQLVQVSHDLKVQVSRVCSNLNVDGIRGDIVTVRSSRALASYEGRSEVTAADIGRVIVMSLRHRLRKDPLSNIDSGARVYEEFENVFGVVYNEYMLNKI
ncbi:hypothetical protein CEUSTIGMA_g7958.t1 [Chlamydomonas eustigma]|uniref:Mg-protoporphyrin IX chelatase n=1 Tax=Chlamydomonas eustigma TaxID=1157962 RepID=A0A250XCP0_9CHLO|nr:hypothetical protein CEUSTIGMA_g7958.t1 [Chlamydomonas eustigma]|eukprot:GAX80520.1 hypothetical protein CEUSTIGMA_g7958.t1 [Chlamydomonas eustigma]